MSVLESLFAKPESPDVFSCRVCSSVKQAGTSKVSWEVVLNSSIYSRKSAYSNEPAAYLNASVVITCFTPGPADRLHYTQGLPGGGLDICGA